MVDSSVMRKTPTVPEIKPLDQYNFNRAKIRASLGWLVSKSYGTEENVPVELREPFYCDQYEQEHIKPPVTRLLLSSELYSRASSQLMGGHAGSQVPPRDHGVLLQFLTKKGVAPRDQDVLVTEADLKHKPIKMSAHLAVIDSLMAVGAMATVSEVKMPDAVEHLGGGAGWENALLYWINRLNQKLRENTEEEPVQRSQQPSTELQPVHPSCPTRWYWKLVPHAIAFCLKESGNKPPVIRYRKDKILHKQTPTFPLVTAVKDLSNGCAIAAVIHFYCPSRLRLEDVCLKDTMSVADSLYNLQLIRDFCQSSLRSCFPLALEDLLYTPPALQVNIMSFMAELLGCFELQKPDFVQPRETLDLTDPSGLICCTTPTSGNSNSASPSFIFKQPFLPMSSPGSGGHTTGSLTQSTSMSHVESAGSSWTKKHISRPLSAVSFSIPFGLDSDVDIVMGNPVGTLLRSISSDSLAPALPAMTRAPYTPPEDLSHLLSQGPAPPGSHNGPLAWATQALGDVPSMEEALQIIHKGGKLEPRLRPEGAPDGFYLHSPDGDSPVRLSSSAPSRSGVLYRTPSKARQAWCRSEESRDDNSVKKVGSVDSDVSEEPSKPRSTPGTPANDSNARRGRQGGPENGTAMTSFAERRKKQQQVSDTPTLTPTGEAPAHMTTWAQRSAEEESPSKSPALNTEMSELGARLEEKRQAIEAQKRRIEAIFAKHRQKLGKSAFLQLQREQQGGTGDEGEVKASPVTEENSHTEGEVPKPPAGEEGESKPPPRLDKQVTFSKETEKRDGAPVPPLGDYNDAVTKLNAALCSLQSDMRRLSDQQRQLMSSKKAKPTAATPAWVIPGGRPPSRLSRESGRDLPSTSPSPSPSRKGSSRTSPKSPQAPHRRTQSVPPKSPRQPHASLPRPLELKFPPLGRVLTPPKNVDTLPHLRKVSPSQCQVQTSSSFHIGAPPSTGAVDTSSETGSSEDQAIFSLELEDERKEAPDCGGGSSSGAPSECSFESEGLSTWNSKHGSLMEISLSSLKGPEEDLLPQGFPDSNSQMCEMKGGLGFFFKDEAKPEDEMAQRKAALLEKQQKRTEEMKRRRQEQERERESRAPSQEEFRSQSVEDRLPPSWTPPPGGTPQRRGEFTRQEYQRRQQLKIMEDLDKVLRQKPTTVRAVKKQRPKTEFRDDSGLSRSPAKGFMGPRLSKVYSHSSLNLSSVANNSGDNGGSPSAKKSPSRTLSPAKLMSPSRLANQNGEKDWENTSNASSPASLPEYTGPKLYKEPSFKSNKFIIQNALTRCCLAGKVNETQKSKIAEELEKSTANHFLILFRDSSCQFRAVYTMNPETEELVRLAGVGPRVIGSTMVESIYKYSSDRKQFTPIPSKTMSMSVDAFTIPAHLWHSKRPTTPKKPSTPK